MGTILIFMDQQITAVIVNRRENMLVKGVGYHLDLFVCSIALIICSLLGLPWFIGMLQILLKDIVGGKLEFMTIHDLILCLEDNFHFFPWFKYILSCEERQ